MDLRYELYIFRKYRNMFNISPNITKFMDNQPMKDRKDFKPCKINITT